jgi:hypothetical protein
MSIVQHTPAVGPIQPAKTLPCVGRILCRAPLRALDAVEHLRLVRAMWARHQTGLAPIRAPDNNATFAFCAYHSSVDFSDVGHVLYSVQPYQNVPLCQVQPGTPNPQ